jgi:hypothetical protein
MEEKNKAHLFLLIVILIAVVAVNLFVIFKKPDETFKEAFKDANKRLDIIHGEIVKSQSLIQKTQSQLDSIQSHIEFIKVARDSSVAAVTANNDAMQRKLNIQEAKLKNLTQQYDEIQKEKNILSTELDSIAQRIQNDTY